MEPMTFETSRLDYVLLISGALACLAVVSTFFGVHLLVPIVVVPVFAAPVIYGLIGLQRPHRVVLENENLIVRPVVGRPKLFERSAILSCEEITSIPFASLIIRTVDERSGKQRSVTLSNRLVLAGLGIRHDGREVGMVPSTRQAMIEDWLATSAS